ncbi:MAG: type IV pilus modification PilV family protein [Actinomycetes bacterium]
MRGRTVWLRARMHGQEGLGLIELMVAIVVFALLATAVLTTLLMTINTTRLDRNRLAAANMATRELEVVRAQFTQNPLSIITNQVVNPDPYPSGTVGTATTPGTASTVGPVAYTVTRTAQWITNSSGGNACSGGSTGQPNYLDVHVQVTWGNMGGVAPVVSDTLLATPKGLLTGTTGAMSVQVINRTGAGEQGQTVYVNGPGGYATTGVTPANGCAVFAFLAPGTYTVSLNTPGYVDQNGVANPSQSVAVTTGATTNVPTFSYDQAATLALTLAAPIGFTLPAGVSYPVTLGNSVLQPLGVKPFPGSGATRTLTPLWPSTSGYTAWVGDCQAADPAQYPGGNRGSALVTNPGQTTAGSVGMGGVAVIVTNDSAIPQAGRTVTATFVPPSGGDQGCPSGESYTLGTTDSLGQLAVGLPYGTWQITAGGGSQQVSVTPSTPTPSITVVTS